LESFIYFFEIPSRNKLYATSVSSEIISWEFNKNCKILCILMKECNKAEWSIKLYDLNKLEQIISTHLKIEDYFKNNFTEVSFSWMDQIIIISTKYSTDKTQTLNIFPCNVEKKNNQTRAVLWNKDKFITNVKGSEYIPSNNGIHLLLVCFDKESSNNYGKIDIYSYIDNAFNKGQQIQYTSASKVCWDPSGRFFIVELSRYKPEGFIIYDCFGNLMIKMDNLKICKVLWRPRHNPLFEHSKMVESITKDMKNISRKFEEMDIHYKSKLEQEIYEIRKKKREAFLNIVNKRKSHYNTFNSDREKLNSNISRKIVESEYIKEDIIEQKEEMITEKENK